MVSKIKRADRFWALALALPLLLSSIACGQGGSTSIAPQSVPATRATAMPVLTWYSAAHPAPTQLPPGTHTGALAVSVRVATSLLTTRALPANTATLTIVLTGTQLLAPFPIVLTSSQIVNGQASLSVSNLPPGMYTLDVSAQDQAGNVLAAGRATLSIAASAVVPVDLLLSPPSTGGQGGLAISIDTPVTGSPTTSYPTGTVAATVS